MLFSTGLKPKLIDSVNHFAQVVAGLNLVSQLTKDLTDLVFNRVCRVGSLLELF